MAPCRIDESLASDKSEASVCSKISRTLLRLNPRGDQTRPQPGPLSGGSANRYPNPTQVPARIFDPIFHPAPGGTDYHHISSPARRQVVIKGYPGGYRKKLWRAFSGPSPGLNGVSFGSIWVGENGPSSRPSNWPRRMPRG